MTSNASIEPEPVLQAIGLTKRFGDVTVLRDASLNFYPGEIHSLLGANGAGKSTLCKIISGLLQPSDGTMKIGSTDFAPKTKQHAESAGVEIVQQELSLIGTLSVAENLLLTRFPNRMGYLKVAEIHRTAREILDRFGLADVDTRSLVQSLGIGRQQMVEIAMGLARDCRLLILDEPTAALSSAESEQLFENLKRLRDRGVSIIYISHRLNEVAELSDRVTVLRDGYHIATRATAGKTDRPMDTDEMVELISGDVDSKTTTKHQSHCQEDIAIRVDELNCGIVRDVSFMVRRGERFGISGLIGSGRTELLRAIFGADVAESGEVFIVNRPSGSPFRHPRQAVAAGLAMVTEDRKQNGLLLSLPIRINATLSGLRKRFSRLGLLAGSKEKRATREIVDELEIRCQGIDQPVGTLSGGNQQKVAVAKWLVRDAEVFLFDEPTRGIDVAARRRIYRLMESLSRRGKACVIVSSDLDELMETCDTIAVMCDGRLVQIFQRESLSQPSLASQPTSEITHHDQWNQEALMQASFAEYVQ